MKPLAIFQHSEYAEPGYVTEYLDQRGIPWTLYRLDRGDPVPDSAARFCGLCFQGGAMGVNDDYPWIAQEIALIHEADRLDIPLIGHCFGSQLMAKAFGAPVTRNQVKEIGWGWLSVVDRMLADEWLGPDVPQAIRSFQWHGDTFSFPKGARLLLSSDFCANQAYVLRGMHLGMQSHLEMTPELVRKCAAKGSNEVAAELRKSDPGAVEPVESMLQDLEARTAEINATLRRLYDRWIVNLRL